MNPIEALKFEAEMRGKKTYSPAEAKQNIARTLEGAARSMPILGNALSVRDIAEAKGEAQRFREQGFDQNADRQDRLALAAVPGAVLPAMSGAASAEGAASRAGVFVPAGESKLAETARALRSGGAPNKKVWEDTGLIFGPDGTLRRRISDLPMEVDKSGVFPGDTTKLGDVVKHPELFEQFPSLASTPAHWSDKVDMWGRPLVFTHPKDNSFAISMAGEEKDMRAQIAKLLQYQVNREAGFSKPLRHEESSIPVSVFQGKAAAAKLADEMPETASKYFNSLDDAYKQYEADVLQFGKMKAAQKFSARTGANVDSKVVVRQAADEEADKMYPYSRNLTGRGTSQRMPAFENMTVLPPENATPEQMRRFLDAWANYGSGAHPQNAPLKTR